MKRVLHRAETLNVEAFARDGAELSGTLPIDQFSRLMSSVASADGSGSGVVWEARGEARPVRAGPPQIWLHLKAQGEVHLQCQRCLESMRWPLEVERSFLFVGNEEEAAELDAEEGDYDVLALPRQLDLLEILEDELLLELPQIPRHAV